MPINQLVALEFFEEIFNLQTKEVTDEKWLKKESFFTEELRLDRGYMSLSELLDKKKSPLEALSETWKQNDDPMWELPNKVEDFIQENLQEIEQDEEVVRNIRDFVYTVV